MKLYLSLLLTLVAVTNADVYLHSMRGSNNRLNERSANRQNANRLFDSQNNNRGGYNAGDAGANPAQNENEQYRMKYFQSSAEGMESTDGSGQSYLSIEWTNQHGCGGNEDSDPHKQNCNIVLQYMCQDDTDDATGQVSENYFRNGRRTNTPEYDAPNNLNENQNQVQNRRDDAVDIEDGYHEPWSWYDSCYVRQRNQGLFTADQHLNNNNLGYSSAIYTRQNPNGNRYGYECPEERDYYPYFHPSPWKDIAVLSENETTCSYYQENSFNVHPYHECVEHRPGETQRKHFSKWNNEAQCTANGGTWTALYNYLEKVSGLNQNQCLRRASGSELNYIWQIPYDSVDGTSKECLVALPAPHCQAAPWTRSNHLGNGREGAANNYTWTLPYFPSGEDKRCVFRIRYNISTDDYDPFFTDSASNQNAATMVQSPVQQNPYVEIGAGLSPLRLAINTAQFGRTFQDRSHVFLLKPRPSGLEQERIYNLNVRGKRGNIVQTYPAVEYDFHPNTLTMRQEDLVHIQWTGSNTHNNGNPAGDGQAGDAGEGQAGTDRNNREISNLNENFPLPYEITNMWKGAQIKWIYHGHPGVGEEDLAISMATAGYYMCVTVANCPDNSQAVGQKDLLNNLLNNANASFGGALLRFQRGTHHYLCTRNNNFTNRSQKGTIVVV